MYEELVWERPNLAERWDDRADTARPPSVTEVSGSRPTFARDGRLDRSVGQATSEAYERYAAEIHGFLVRTVRDRDAAADLVADTFTKLLTEERANRTPIQPRAWLFRVAANLAMSRGRRMKTALRSSRELEFRASHEQHAPSPEHEAMDRERDRDLHEALARVSLEERTALLLAASGYDGATIATVIGKSHNATRTLMCRARRRLRTALQEHATP